MRPLARTAFALTLLAYLASFIHLAFSLFQGIPGLFTPFGAPAALVLCAYYIMSRPPPRERIAALAAGACLELGRIAALHAGAAAGDPLFAIAFDFTYGFGLGLGFAVTLALVLREFSSKNCSPLPPSLDVSGLAAMSQAELRRTRAGEQARQGPIGAAVEPWGVGDGIIPPTHRASSGTRALPLPPKGGAKENFGRLAALMAAQVFLIYSLHLVSVAAVVPYTVDEQLHRFELKLGIYPAAEIALLYKQFPLFRAASTFAYDTLAGLVFAVWLLQWKQPSRPPVDLLAACALAVMLTALYLVTPACGPRQVFGVLFPRAIPTANIAAYISLDPKLLRNAMPSLHTVWVLLAWICAHYHQPSRLLARIVATLAILTLLATMGTGEHYFVDLVVAVPLTLFIYALACFSLPLRARLPAMVAGVSLATLWLLALCFAPGFFSAASAWGAIALTVGTSFFLLHRLAGRAESQRQKSQHLQRGHASL